MFKLIKFIFQLKLTSGLVVIFLFLIAVMALAENDIKNNEPDKASKVVEQPNSVKIPNNEWAGRMCDQDDYELLAECKRIAKIMGYNPDEIDEAYYTKRLPNRELGRQKSWGEYDLVLISNDMKNASYEYQMANIIHEVIHVYTGNDLVDWHKEMKRAIKNFPKYSYYLTLDELEDHPIN